MGAEVLWHLKIMDLLGVERHLDLGAATNASRFYRLQLVP
jgi:hypothetical protein